MDPGVSLFGGGTDQLQLDGNAQHRQEEEEAIEDQRRRDQELENLLTNAFDDLIDEEDDDDHSVVSSSRVHDLTGLGHSNIGSLTSSQDSPSDYYSYSHGQTHTHTQTPHGTAQQFPNGPITSTAGPRQVYDPSQGYHSDPRNMGLRGGYNGYTTSVPLSYGNEYNTINAMNMHHHENGLPRDSAIQQDADNFGYLSTIPQTYHNGGLSNGDINFNHTHTEEDVYRLSELNSQEQLMVLYGARVREVKQLSETVESLRREHDAEVDQLKRKLMLVEAEKQGAYLSHKEAQNLLVEQKTQLSKLQQEVEDLRLSNLTLEKAKEELSKELDIAKASAADLVQKVAILERKGNGLQSEKQMESFLKTVQQRHEKQLKEIQEQLDSITAKYSQKDHDCSTLERKLRDAQRAYEALIVEKGETVNELVGQLEEAQRRLVSHASSTEGQDAVRFKVQLEQVQADRNRLEEQLTVAVRKLEAVEKDLQQYEAVSKMGLLSNGESSFETDSIAHLGMGRKHSISGHDRSADNSKDSRRSSRSTREKDDLNSKLRDELRRALQGQRSKREEIRKLQEELEARDQKIKTMKEQEKVYFTEAEKFKKNLTSVLERLKRQEDETSKLHAQSEELKSAEAKVLTLQKERDNLDKQLKNSISELEKLKSLCEAYQKESADLQLQVEQSKVRQVDQASSEFLAFHDESIARLREESSRQLEAQVVDYRVRMEQAQKECEEVKKLYIEVCSAKRGVLARLQEEEARSKQLSQDLQDAKDALQSLEELHKQERELNRRLKVDLEKERERTKKAVADGEDQLGVKVEERVAELAREQERRVHDLERAKREALARAEKLQHRLTVLEQDSQRMQQLEAECAMLRDEAVEAPRRQQAELERISRELKQSRERVVQLEKRLRSEFQTQMEAITSERDSLQAQIKQKENQLQEYLEALSRIRPPCREVSTNTSIESGLQSESGTVSNTDIAPLRQQITQLKNQLDQVEKNHSAAFESVRRQYEEKVAELEECQRLSYEQKLASMQAQHQASLTMAEENVKEETVRYFAEEISRLEDKHRSELGALARKLVDTESAFAKHLTSLKSALQEKTQQLEDLREAFKKNDEDRVIKNIDTSNDAAQMRSHVAQLQKQMESDRNKMAEVMSEWAAEVQTLRNRETAIEAKMEELRGKYKTAKKAALHYKKISAEKEKHMIDEWRRMETGYREALSRVQAKVGDIVGGREREVADQLNRIESHYEAQIQHLANKLNQKAVVT